MKQLKFLMVAFTLLMGISLTSCLNSESDPYSYGGGMVKVTGYMGYYSFKSADGKTTITPTSASISALEANGFKMSEMSGKVAQIYYRWNSSLLTIPADEKDIKGVELYSIESLDNKVEIVQQKGVSANDSLAFKNNAPIISLEYGNGGPEYKPKFFDETTLLLPVNYFISQKRHFLTLLYYPNEQEGSTLRLYLSHNSNGDTEANNSTSYSLTANSNGYYGLGLYYKAYNISSVLSYFNHGSSSTTPPTVEIVTKVNQYSTKLDDTQTAEKVFTVTYKAETDK